MLLIVAINSGFEMIPILIFHAFVEHPKVKSHTQIDLLLHPKHLCDYVFFCRTYMKITNPQPNGMSIAWILLFGLW